MLDPPTPMQCINGASLSQSWYCADSAPTFISLVGPTRSRPVRLAFIVRVLSRNFGLGGEVHVNFHVEY